MIFNSMMKALRKLLIYIYNFSTEVTNFLLTKLFNKNNWDQWFSKNTLFKIMLTNIFAWAIRIALIYWNTDPVIHSHIIYTLCVTITKAILLYINIVIDNY